MITKLLECFTFFRDLSPGLAGGALLLCLHPSVCIAYVLMSFPYKEVTLG